MDLIQNHEVWRQIPPEEKIELMSKAQSKGVLASLTVICICCTIAIGLQFDWLLWAGFISVPFVYQFTSGKAWRAIRPIVMLEYLAARAAARRYAYTVKADDLSLNLVFRGKMENVYDEENVLDALEAAITDTHEASVWVALFNDAVILMSERKGGAELQFGHVINQNLIIEQPNPDQGEYSSDRELILEYEDRYTGKKRIRLTSRYPAALVVFERKLIQLQNEREAKRKALEEVSADMVGRAAKVD